MSLNDIKLSPIVIAGLYPSSLVESGANTDQTETARPVSNTNTGPLDLPEEITSAWKWLGNNRKNILVIVRSADAVHLPDKELDFLTMMLTACKLGLDDVAILNLNNHPGASYKELIAYFKSKIVWLFAVDPASFGLPMNFPHFQLQAFAGNTFLFSPSLEELENDKVLKSKLWVCFKRLFNL